MKYLAAVLLFFIAAHHSFAGQTQLSRLGDWEIVVADDATASEQYAATEFQTLYQQWTGVE